MKTKTADVDFGVKTDETLNGGHFGSRTGEPDNPSVIQGRDGHIRGEPTDVNDIRPKPFQSLVQSSAKISQ